MKSKVYAYITPEVSKELRYLHQSKGIKGKDLVKEYPQYTKSSIYAHMKKNIDDKYGDGRKQNPGRPKKEKRVAKTGLWK